MAKSIKDLRQEKGYRSAREFADALGIATSSMSRYDKDPETIPLKHAWAMADLLECSIDEVVGRAPVTSGVNELQEFYDGLTPETRALMDEFMEFCSLRDERARRQEKAEQDRRAEDQCRYYQHMFRQTAYERAAFGEVVDFGSPRQERAAFERFLLDQAAAKRKPGIDLHCEGLEEEMRDGYLDSDGTERHFSEEEIQSMLEDERTRMDEEYGRKDREVIDGIMEAYDRLFGTSTVGFGPRTTVEYAAVRLPK